MISNNYVPEKTGEYNVYSNGSRLIGVAAELELPSVKMKTSTIEGVGINGEIDSPTLGQFESMKAVIKFNSMYSDASELADPSATQNLTVRAAQQVYDKNGGYVFKGFRAVMSGRTKEFNPGTVKKGEAMGAEVTMELTYLMYELDGETIIEIDKLNSVYKVNGKDLLSEINALV